MVIFYSGVHRKGDLEQVRAVSVKLALMQTYYDVRLGGSGLRTMKRLMKNKGRPAW